MVGSILRIKRLRWQLSLSLPRSTLCSIPFTPVQHFHDAKSEKHFEFQRFEQAIYGWWESAGYFQPMEVSENQMKEDPFVMTMPPPNVTGKLHVGHALFIALQDTLARFHRMRGRPTLWLPGTDHAGIATQLLVERQLQKEGKSREEVGRDEFVRRVWEWKAEHGGQITSQMRRLGASADWSREKFTLDSDVSVAVTEAFLRLHEKGLVYRGAYMVNWSPSLQSALSDLEVEFSEEEGTLYYFKYEISEEQEQEGSSISRRYLPVATTRPETILGDTAVCVHPDDHRYQDLIGLRAIVPLSGGRTIPGGLLSPLLS
jgi:valyl-tRNA synthetase